MATQIVDAAYVLEHLGEGVIVDLRPEFMYDNSHIPGAKTVDFWFYKTQNGFTLPTRLAKFIMEMGVGLDDPVTVYCHNGTMSSEAVLMLESQGFTDIRHYDKGWGDWLSDRSRPTER